MNTEYQRRIVNYLKGKMTPEEEVRFIADCKSNDELKAQAIATAKIVKFFKTYKP